MTNLRMAILAGMLVAGGCAAKMAALRAPLTAMHATGTPGGICSVLRKASTPASGPEAIGTPITGSVVTLASTPDKAALMPAAATMTFSPRPAAEAAYSCASAGVRCAESIRISCAIPKAPSCSAHFFIASRSLSDPITMPTSGLWFIFSSLNYSEFPNSWTSLRMLGIA